MRVFLEQTLLPVLCAKQKLDVIISNYVSPIAARCPQIVVIHDMLYRRYPNMLETLKLAYWRLMVPMSIEFSAGILTVSEFSRREIIAFHPKARKKVFVIVEGIRPSLASVRPAPLPSGLKPENYLLCVATFGRHKNLDRLLRAFAGLARKHLGLKMVFVGGARTPDAKEYFGYVEALARALEVSDRVIFTNHVREGELASLYQNALALVLPSLYEGFGLPVIEAQHFGCPVVCSNAGSLPEVAGRGAITFEPTRTGSIRDALLSVINEPQRRLRLRELGYENVSRFGWERAAAEVMEALRLTLDMRG